MSLRDIGLRRRYRAEKRFRIYGVLAIGVSLAFLAMLMFSIVAKGYTAFAQTAICLPIYFDKSIIDPQDKAKEDKTVLFLADYPLLVRQALARELNIDLHDRKNLTDLKKFYSASSRKVLRNAVAENPAIIGTTRKIEFLASADIDSANKGQINLAVPESDRKVSDRQLAWLRQLKEKSVIYKIFNKNLFLGTASSRAENAGLATAFIGSLYLMLIVLVLALPLGVGAAIYLAEYAPKNKFTDVLEININNLAAVPSIVFGLLGLSIFINFMGLPRSSSLVGGLVLCLTTLPTIIISTRSALRSIPSSIRSAALALGASKTQMVFHHCLPLAMPGILTGAIIGIAQAMGQTAPLLLIGMVAFVASYPVTPLDPATVLPVQIYIWSGEMQRAFVERTSAAIILLLLFLILMNLIAVILRQKFEKKW
ncbi:phosphate ABC transporter permease PstA [Bartonella sp. TP]|uniref:phosphate ABC transporter permease PstA n=1 Tax=Bartonella sp. TP TaxID=3057550 RepID=UPI0025B0E543|nr:phosphate ABC transporter permease PstA [Bartonella sp. TP]WJW80373.1 phosphate ABC transporter permease PstA [Bartonella sp. TP]